MNLKPIKYTLIVFLLATINTHLASANTNAHRAYGKQNSSTLATKSSPPQVNLHDFNLSNTGERIASSDDDTLLDIIPAIVAATKEEDIVIELINPEWAVTNSVCCPTSAATFALTIDNQTSSSTLDSCNASDSSFEGFTLSTVGSKSVTGILSAATCGDPLLYSFEQSLEAATRYVFSLELIDGSPVIVVFFEEIETQNSQTNSFIGSKSNMKKLGIFPLNTRNNIQKGQQLYQNILNQ